MEMQSFANDCRGPVRKLIGAGLLVALTVSAGHANGDSGMTAMPSEDSHAMHQQQAMQSEDPHAMHQQPAMQSEDPHAMHQPQAMQSEDPHAMHQQQAMQSEDPHAMHQQQAQSPAAANATTDIDLPAGATLLNQHGQSLDLVSDVIGDRIAVVDFVYTSCTTVCPVVSSIFSIVQEKLGERMEKDVALVTITVDPTRDTPHRLESYSKNFKPGANWNWLTGEKKTMDRVLTALGAYTPLYEDHPAMVLIGDGRSSQWYRYYGFPDPAVIESKVLALLNERNG